MQVWASSYAGVLRHGSSSGGPHVRKPTGRYLLALQVFRVPVTGFVAVVEGALAVQQDTHVVAGVVTPPHAHSRGSVAAQMLDDATGAFASDQSRPPAPRR